LKKIAQTFNDGDVIFREGESSDTAYEIVSGNVEIAKTGDDGEMRLAVLKPGEMFGEMGVLDQGKRSATAKAVGPVSVNAISRKDFLAGVQDKPDMAEGIMGNLVERLRGADTMVAGGGAEPDDQAGPQQLPKILSGEDGLAKTGAAGVLGRFFGWKSLPKTENVKVRVAPLIGDDDGSHRKRVVRALEKRKGLRVKTVRKPLNIDPDVNSEEQARMAAAARKVLADTDSDLLIWGECPLPGMTLHLKFISFAAWNEDKPGSFSSDAVLPLPAEFGDLFADFLYAVSLAALVPKSETKAATLARTLPLALDSARAALEDIPADLTRRERGHIHLCFANALTTVAVQRADLGLFQRSRDTYKECLALLTEDEAPVEWAFVQKNLGAVLQAIAERTDDKNALDEAVGALRAALKVLNRDDTPLEWAAVQNRLGVDLDSGDTEMLKHAIGAYQSALQVYTRTETPMRWAEVMDNLAQVTQILGEQLKNAEALEKAAQACRAALEVRTKAKAPLLWAATQNNLGSSLFLLGKMTKNADHLRGAAEAFDLATSLYRAREMEKMAAVTEKNLSHVNQLLGQSQAEGVAEMGWEDDG
jgi:CRP-like cAMP-binding protein/tetratricopeptide (TPR) repeat protein